VFSRDGIMGKPRFRATGGETWLSTSGREAGTSVQDAASGARLLVCAVCGDAAERVKSPRLRARTPCHLCVLSSSQEPTIHLNLSNGNQDGTADQ